MATLIVRPDRLLPAEPRVRAIARRFDRLGVGEGPLRQARARIEARRTCDDPADDLDVHARLGEDPEITTRITPTFRPDGYLEPGQPGRGDAVKRLGAVADIDVGDYAGYAAALEQCRRYFVARGAVSADDGHADPVRRPDRGHRRGFAVSRHVLTEGVQHG